MSSRNARRTILSLLLLAGLLLVPHPTDAQTAPSVPRGFRATVYASGLVNPTALAVGPDGRLYVAQENGAIRAIGKGGTATVASGFATPLGLAWHAKRLYVSFTGGVSVLTPSKSYRTFAPKVIISGLPIGRHQNDGLAFHGGWMYLGVGSTCNACTEADPRSATIMRFHPNGSGGAVFARGLRNPYGLAVRPGTADLYATDNGRDDEGDLAPDELNRIVRGGRYGWPDCWGVGGGSNCGGTIPPVALFEPHSSADGIAFYTGHTFPQRYRGDAFVAEWGSNYSATGHKVKDVHFSGNKATVSDFATGLSHPLAVAVAKDGALLVADWGTGIIWRVQSGS